VSPIARVLAGTGAIVLPHSLGQWLGIFDVRGGRSLWLFVEIDTIVFDMVLAFAVFSMAVAVRRRTLGAPVFWLALFVTGTIGLALVYTVSNFGTLFRHRDMLLVGLVLLTLAAAAPAARLENLPD
jgi:magnesium-transporting ATPase (P-type)